MITLYQSMSSPFAEKIRRVLGFKQLAFVIEEVDRSDPASYEHVSPYGKVPAIDDGGKPVWDSTDIVIHLDATYPQRPVIPADGMQAALAHIIEDWADESLYFYELTMRASWPNNAPRMLDEIRTSLPDSVTEEQALDYLLSASTRIVETQGLGRKSRDHVLEDMHRHLEALGTILRDRMFLVGDRISIADISVLAQFQALLSAEEFVDMLRAFPQIAEWMQRIRSAAPDPAKYAGEQSP